MVDVVKQLRVEVTSMDCNVEKMTASLTDTVSVRGEAVERAYIVITQLAASVCCEDACKFELNGVKEDLLATRVERANLRRPVNNLV